MDDRHLRDELFAWPSGQANKDLFTTETDLAHERAILGSGWQAWPAYLAGFRLAAETIVDRFRATRHDQDLLAYPVVYLYRHFAELSLKYLARQASRVAGEPVVVPAKHELRPLWQLVRRLWEDIWPDEDQDALDGVERTVLSLDAVDPGGMVFRYPEDKKGEAHLPKDAETFDLLHFASLMTEFANWVDGVDGALDAAHADMREMCDGARDAGETLGG